MSPRRGEKNRCRWAIGTDDLYLAYHDEKWGVPLRNDQKLFEFLLLALLGRGELAQFGVQLTVPLVDVLGVPPDERRHERLQAPPHVHHRDQQPAQAAVEALVEAAVLEVDPPARPADGGVACQIGGRDRPPGLFHAAYE